MTTSEADAAPAAGKEPKLAFDKHGRVRSPASARGAAGALLRLAFRLALLFPVLPVLYLLEPFYRIRLGTIYTQRFGHLAINTETFIRKMKFHGVPRRTFYFFFGWAPCNRQLMEMWKCLRGFPVRYVESHLGTRIMFAWRPILSRTRFWEKSAINAKEYRLFTHTEPIHAFTSEEEAKGRAALREMGIGDDDWFVCFHARDGNYFRQWRPEFEGHWRKVDFRNVDIMKYLKAADFITSLGGFAVRYGAFVEHPLPNTGNPRIIDYSTQWRTDFLDVYLAAKCRFFLGMCSGPTSVATMFNVPVLYVEHFPFNQSSLRDCDILVKNRVVRPGTDEPVGYWVAQRDGYYSYWSEDVSRESSSLDPRMDLFEMIGTDEDDILDGCKDMIDSLEGRQPSEEAKKLQDFYAERYFSHSPDYEFGGNIGPRFAIKYRDLIVPPGNGGTPG